MQQDVDATGPNAQKVNAGVRTNAGNLIIVAVAFGMPSAREIVIMACKLSDLKQNPDFVQDGISGVSTAQFLKESIWVWQ